MQGSFADRQEVKNRATRECKKSIPCGMLFVNEYDFLSENPIQKYLPDH